MLASMASRSRLVAEVNTFLGPLFFVRVAAPVFGQPGDLSLIGPCANLLMSLIGGQLRLYGIQVVFVRVAGFGFY